MADRLTVLCKTLADHDETPMTRLQKRLISALMLLMLGACAEMPSNAPIDDRTSPRAQKNAKEPAAEAIAPDAPGFYTVKKGDTLRRIAQQFNLSVRDITDLNSLANPNDIKVGQVLRVASPEGTQLTSVPMDTGLEVRPLDARPAPTPASPSSTSPSSAAGAPGLKTGPLGNKVAYTEQAWTDMQRGEPSAARTLDTAKKPEAPAAPGKFVWPTEGRIVSSFDPSRKGIDIAGQAGQPVVAASDGTVLYAKNMRGYGNLVIVDHGDGLVSAYAHNKTILVKEGQTVARGQRIAEMGDTDADSVKLHFEIRQLGKPVDPVGMLPGR